MRTILYAIIGIVVVVGLAIIVLRERTLTVIVERQIGAVPVIEISGPLDKAGARKMIRALRRVESAQPAYVIISFDSPGGELSGTLEVADTISKLSVPSIGLVHEGVAGTVLMIAATDRIYFTPAGVCNAAVPVVMPGDHAINDVSRELILDMKTRVKAYAGDNGHDPSVFEAMMNVDMELMHEGEVWKSRGELLTITSEEAVEIGLASGIAASPEEVVTSQKTKK